MNGWIIPLLAAIGGAIAALIGREFIDWYKRPRLHIDFEEKGRQKPYIPDFNDDLTGALTRSYRVKYLRLVVSNTGKKPAMNCTAKIKMAIIRKGENNDKNNNETDPKILHWSRRDPALYRDGNINNFFGNNEKMYVPIDLEIADEELLDVFRLRYSSSTVPDTDHSPRLETPHIETVSVQQLIAWPDLPSHVIVTVYSSNTSPKSFRFKVDWDGTVEGFDKAFTRG